MSWFNYYGLAIALIMMLPNIIFSFFHKDGFANHFSCKKLEIAEQIGRYATFALMIFNIPYTYIGWLFNGGELVYLIVNGSLLAVYEVIWFVMRNKNNMARALLLSAIPSMIFIFSGVMIMSIPLILFSFLFAVSHIVISVKNAGFVDHSPKKEMRH